MDRPIARNIVGGLAFAIVAITDSLFAQSFTWPVANPSVGQTYACRNCLTGGSAAYVDGINMHAGVDVSTSGAAYTVPVKAAADGWVEKKISFGTPSRGLGNTVILRHANGKFSLYGHLDSISAGLVIGAFITQGTQLGIMGHSAYVQRDTSFGIHVHFEIKNNPTLGNISDSNGVGYVGYVPGHPDLYDYTDPRLVISQVSTESITPIVLKNPPPGAMNVRGSPGTTYYGGTATPQIGTLGEGHEAVATKRTLIGSTYWYFIDLPSRNAPLEGSSYANNGLHGGWISGEVAVQDTSAAQLQIVNTEYNIRYAAGTGNSLIAKAYAAQRFVAAGAAAPGAGCSGSWYPVYVAGNPTVSSATGWICGDGVTVIGGGVSCSSFSISPQAETTGSGSGSRDVTITGAPSGCQGGNWSASGNGSWLTVSKAIGSGSDVVTVYWVGNQTQLERSDKATIATKTFSVTQAGITAPCYTLNTGVNPGGSGSISINTSPNCAGAYTASTAISLAANANSGYAFSTWTASGGSPSSTTSNPMTFTITGNASVTANFNPAQTCYALSTSSNPNAGGSVVVNTPPNCGGNYTALTPISLTASPNNGYVFSTWSTSGGTPSSTTANPLTFTITGNASITANFNANSGSDSLFTVDGNTVALWRMNEGPGSAVWDSAGVNNGTASGTTVVAGRFGNARSFSGGGGGDHVTVPDAAALRGMSQFSIEAWVYPTSFDLNCSNQTEAIVGKGDATDPYDMYQLTITRNQSPGCGSAPSFTDFVVGLDVIGAGTNVGVQSTIHHAPNQWYYVAGTYDGSIVRVYVNGILEAQSAPHTPVVVTTTRPLYINNHTWAFADLRSNGRMGGLIDEVRLSNVARTSAEISSAATGMPQVPAPLNVVATALSAAQIHVSWGTVGGAASYQVLRKAAGGGYAIVGTPQTNSFIDTGVAANASYLYHVKTVDSGNNLSVPSAADIATTVMFTDDPIVTAVTIAKAVHVTHLRTAVNAVRSLAGLASATFTDTIAAGVPVRAAHVAELRNSLDSALAALGRPSIQYVDSTLSIQATPLKGVHIQQLRSAVK